MLPRFTLALLAAGAFAAETDEPVNKDKAIYVHPVLTIATVSLDMPIYVPITFEDELEGGKSITLQPTLIMGSVQGSSVLGYKPPKTDVFGVTVIGSLRKYFNSERCSGLYAAPAVGLGYAKAKRSSSEYFYSESASAISFAVLGYLGTRGKWDGFTSYFDIGAGRQWVSVSGDSNTDGVSGSGWAYDINLGVGVPF